MTAGPKPEPGSGEGRVLLKIMESRHMSIRKELEAPSAWGRCGNV